MCWVVYNFTCAQMDILWVYVCSCEFFEVWITLVLLLEFAVLTVILALTLLNGRVKRKHFKVTGIVAFAYFVAPIWFISTIINILLRPISLSYSYALGEIGTLSVVGLVCLVIFIPPIFPILSAWHHQLVAFYRQSHRKLPSECS